MENAAPIEAVEPWSLSGEHDIELDSKNRIVVPSAFRRELIEVRKESSLVVLIGLNRITWLYPKRYFRHELTGQPKPRALPDEQTERKTEKFFGATFDLEIDGQNRILIPEKIIRRANLDKKLTLVGLEDHIAIWNRDDWERHVTADLSA
jgi:MraZ protein